MVAAHLDAALLLPQIQGALSDLEDQALEEHRATRASQAAASQASQGPPPSLAIALMRTHVAKVREPIFGWQPLTNGHEALLSVPQT